VYDLEDLDVGSRLSHLMRLVITPELVADVMKNPDRFRAASATPAVPSTPENA